MAIIELFEQRTEGFQAESEDGADSQGPVHSGHAVQRIGRVGIELGATERQEIQRRFLPLCRQVDGRVGARQQVEAGRRRLWRQTDVLRAQQVADGAIHRETDDDLTADDGAVDVVRPEVFGEVQCALLIGVAHQTQLLGEARLEARDARPRHLQQRAVQMGHDQQVTAHQLRLHLEVVVIGAW